MKKKKVVLLLLILAILLSAFVVYFFVFDDSLNLLNDYNFNGIIVKTNDDSNSIAILKENKDTNTYDIYYSSASNAKNFKVGDIVNIKYSGAVMESYPPQISIIAMKKLKNEVKETTLTKIYLEAINNVITRSITSTKSLNIINIDIGSISTDLTLEEKSYILNNVSSYGKTVQGLDKSIVFLSAYEDTKIDGLFITFDKLTKVSESEYILPIEKMTSESNYVKLKLKLTIKDNNITTETLEYSEN